MIKKILEPKSVAIIGASDTEGKVGNMLAHNVIDHGYEEDVYLVNPNSDRILDRETYASLAAIGKKVDCAIISVPAQFVEDVIREGAQYCKNYIVISAGFGETNVDGHNREMRLAQLADQKGLTILGPNCLGIITPSLKLNASFAPGMPEEGSVAFISQSGALAVALVDRARSLHIGFSSVVSIGNKMQLDGSAFIEHFSKDPKTKVIALYLEGIRDGAAFLAAARDAAKRGKKVILLKSGRSEQAQSAIALHTGSLAGDDIVVSAACEKAGVVRVDSIGELFRVVRFATRPLPQAKKIRTLVVTNAGGPGVVTTDAIARTENLCLAKLAPAEKNILAKKLPAAASVHNPIDLLGDAATDRYEAVLKKCITSAHVDAFCVILTPQEQTPVMEIAELVRDMQKAHPRTLIFVSFIGGPKIEEAEKFLKAEGILFFATPDEAITALDRLVGHKLSAHATFGKDYDRKVKAQKIIGRARDDRKRPLYFDECTKLVKMYGIKASSFWDVTEGLSTKTSVSYPCVAKIDDPHILHKSDRGGVILPINSFAQLQEATQKLQKTFPEQTARVIAQPMLPIQTELIVGMKRDVTFGPVVVVGLGGIYTEIFNKTVLFLPPLSRREVGRRLLKGPLGFIFEGVRGQKPYDVETVIDVVIALANLANDVKDIQAIDINPLLIYNDNKKPVAVDVKVVL